MLIPLTHPFGIVLDIVWSLSVFLLCCTLLQCKWQKHWYPVTSYLRTEMSVYWDSMTLTLFFWERGTVWSADLKICWERKECEGPRRLLQQDEIVKSIRVKDSITSTDFQMEKLIQMPSLCFLLFFFWQKLYPWQNCRRATGKRDTTGSGYLRQLLIPVKWKPAGTRDL